MKMGVHLGFLMNVAVGDPVLIQRKIDTPEAKRLARDLTFYYWLGMRGFYFSFPVIIYLIGPSWLLGATLLLIFLLIFLMDYNRFDLFEVFMFIRKRATKRREKIDMLDPILPNDLMDDSEDNKNEKLIVDDGEGSVNIFDSQVMLYKKQLDEHDSSSNYLNRNYVDESKSRKSYSKNNDENNPNNNNYQPNNGSNNEDSRSESDDTEINLDKIHND